MNNESTKEQIRRWIENAIKKAKNPDQKELIKKKREVKRKKIAKQFGF